ncbi:MAG: hypothetical protein AAFN81_05385 [Bacteroidota bacterium]
MRRIPFYLSLFFSVLFLPLAQAQTPNSSYTIQENDWLSSVAERAYDNPHLYHRIIEGTNRKAETDNTFTRINRANQIQVGQKVFIPAAPSTTNLAGIPQTNCEIRLWYNYQVVAIGVINQKWEEEGVDLETRAHRAYELRHEARVNARYLMTDKAMVKVLQDRDMAKYGNPNGPTFEYLLKKNTDNGLTVEEAYQSIIDSSSRTDTRYNADCQ